MTDKYLVTFVNNSKNTMTVQKIIPEFMTKEGEYISCIAKNKMTLQGNSVIGSVIELEFNYTSVK